MNGKLIVAILALVAACVASAASVGVCAHVTRDEFGECVRTYEMMREAGFTDVRSDFDWHVCQREKGGRFDFSKYDKVVDDAAKYGVTVLPILYGIPKWAQPVNEHLGEWRSFVRETVRHFRGRIPVYEIWNEENISAFWKDPDPVKYAAVLKAAYEEVKAVDPSARVAFGGTAGCAWGYIEKTIRAGAKDAFDIVNVHPYRHPHPPEPELTDDLNALKKMMSRNGIADRPIWITELGWPTHKATVPDAPVFRAGLKIARPERQRWRAAYVNLGLPGTSADLLADAVRENLPPGSSCANVTAAELNARLPKGDFDLVVYPFGESYPDDTIDAVAKFVRQGGTLVACGGYPLYFPYRNGKYAGSSPQGAKEGAVARERLHIGVETWWSNKAMPNGAKTFPSEDAAKAGLEVDPAGLWADRFFSDRLLKSGDRMVPLLVGKDKNGGAAVGACVYLFDSDLKGRLVVSSRGRSAGSTSTEAQQAEYTVKAIDSALRQGVEKYFIYEFRAVERDPYYSEHHFGIVHKDFSPKPAYTACRDYLQGKARRANPILDGWYADPQIRRYGATYWIFPTYSHDYREQTFIDAFSSSDLKVWTKHPHAVDAKDFSWVRGAMWAPDAHEKDGKYYVFFAANDPYPVGGRRMDGEPQTEPGIGKYGGIGVAVADRPEGPYRDLVGKPLVDRFWNGAQPIDQYVFQYDGGWYMVYGGWGKCNLVRLADDFKSLMPFADGKMWKDLTPPEYTEGSVMFERKGVWYFMYSSGGWTDGSYSVKYCTAQTPFGPFAFKGCVLSSQPPLATGAGHHSVLNLPGTDEWYICYHRRPIPNSSPHHRVTCLDRLRFDDKGNIQSVKMTRAVQEEE